MKARIVKDKVSFSKSLKLIPENRKEKLELLSIFNANDGNFDAVISLHHGKLKNIVIYNESEV